VTQHLPESFIPYYAQQVSRMCSLPVTVAREGDIFEPDRIYIAPGGASLSCRSDGDVVKAVLDSTRDPLTLARPSVNAMFSALAASYGGGVLGVVFTGIGRDGTAGARKIVENGGVVIAQDRDSSVVWGMPGSVTRAGFTSANLRPGDMYRYIHDRWAPGR
jgi:two-component system chemotaxis response regulator CheB